MVIVDFDIVLFEQPSVNWQPLFPDTIVPLEEAKMVAIHYPGYPVHIFNRQLVVNQQLWMDCPLQFHIRWVLLISRNNKLPKSF
jgi:hypothetical protein